jgi:hypothetical protein
VHDSANRGDKVRCSADKRPHELRGRVDVLSGGLPVSVLSAETAGLSANRPQITRKKKEETMAEQKGDKTEILAMWIMVAVVVLLILAGTGWHMWTHPDWMHGG